MFEKFKESKFAKKCKDLSKNGGFVVTVVCLLLALTVILSVTIATNRAKKQYQEDTTSNVPSPNEQTTQTPSNDMTEGTVEAPSHNETESRPTSAEVEEFKLSLPAQGTVAKGHDSTLQVWSETMGDYRVHLGIDIQTTEGAPVYAAADGTVSKVWDDALMGRCVAIEHEGNVYTFYKNLNKELSEDIAQGKSVKCGQQLGTVGNTAIAELADEPHLHIEMTVNGLAVDPRDYFSDEAKQSLQQGTNYEENADK
ncbi:MAG: M23 family metallopeptidase [Ruminococcaceae bacterium]|nr:M23 family metallopeptidase [Oscillospiraceae bacterium]